MPVSVINDLEAVACAVPFLEEADQTMLNEGEPDSEGNIAVIAPGTGLGEAFLTRAGSGYRAHASEGGRADFAPNGEHELKMLRDLQQRWEHVSFERLCSGLGIPNIYRYLKESGYATESSRLAARLAAAKDPTPVIVEAGLDLAAPCALCAATLDTFTSILGAEAGNLALKVMATGGVYLGGGIPPRILPALESGTFMRAFRNKGRLSELMDRTPVRVILNARTALLGAAYYGLEREGDR